MIRTETQAPRASVFSPLAKAVLDSFTEGVVVFDPDGHLAYANGQAQQVLKTISNGGPDDAETLMPGDRRGRAYPLHKGRPGNSHD